MSVRISGTEPILCAHLLRRVDEKLLELLRSLQPSDWDVQTISPRWKVCDVAAHLLDTALRKLSLARDFWFVEKVNTSSAKDLANLINRLNEEGVTVYRRLSPAVLIDMMELACEQSARFHEALDPFARAAFAVSWAGETQSPNWFDTARELTERWHHQQQIRLATGRPGIMTPELYHPVLDCFLRGLPYLYENVPAADGTTLLVEIAGECGGHWLLSRDKSAWKLVSEMPGALAAQVFIPQQIAWRLFTKGIDRESAKAQIRIEGDRPLGERVLDLTAIVA